MELLPDTHAHLDAAEFDADRDDVLRRASCAGVGRVLAVGSELESSARAVDIASRHDIVFAAVGVHPHNADRFESEARKVRELLPAPKVVAVGEIGLDFLRNPVDREAQLVAFRRQLGWARERNLPVSVHNRGADEVVLEELIASGAVAVLHCFDGTWEYAQRALASGCCISLAGNVTFPRSTELRLVAGNVPTDRLLLETDSPVLAPQARRGRRNEPANLPMIAEAVASVRKVTTEVLSRQVADNAARLFHWCQA